MSSNPNIIDLELPQELIETQIVEDFDFNLITKNFILELNSVYKETRIIVSYTKDWIRLRQKFQREFEENKIQEDHRKLLLKAINSNYYTITVGLGESEEEEEQDQRNNNRNQGEQVQEQEQKRNEYPINKYSQGIPLAEAILINNIPYFIQINQDKKPVFHKKIELADCDIVPPERTEYLSKEYNFASEQEVEFFINRAKEQTLDSLFTLEKTILRKFIDMDDDFINVLAADVVFTHFQDRLGMTHYLLIVGDNNTGKSNILLVFSILGYRAIYDTSITPANIYNFGSQLEAGQCIILEDELGDIDYQLDKKKMYQASYTTGKKVTRMYENNNTGFNNKRKSTRQQGFFLFCFKMFASEKMPDKVKSKGFLERVIPLKALPGDPLYDISEVVDDSGDEEFKELNEELENTRKLLLIYRLLHYNDSIPNIKLNIKNRYKQLTKPLIRLFQNTDSVEKIIKSLSKYLIEKNQEKVDSLDSVLLTFIINMVSEHGIILYNDRIWERLKEDYPEGAIEDKPYSWYIAGCGTLSKQKISDICQTKFGAKHHKDNEYGRGLTFDKYILNKLTANYSIIEGIKIIKEEYNEKMGDKGDKGDKFRRYPEQNNSNNSFEDTTKPSDYTNNNEGNTQENSNSNLKNGENNNKTSISSPKVSPSSPSSPNTSTIIEKIEIARERTLSKFEQGLFTNPFISKSDLTLQDYDYNPEIINNIFPIKGTDSWLCKNCKMKGDKWFMMKHHCKRSVNHKSK